tara:strand:- start:1047 stop:1274 length:228 start_codon:yes stop_codon:yes gene_type:complete
VIHIYECNDGATIYHEVYKTVIGEGWGEDYILTLEDQNEFDLYLDIIKAQGVDFVIHNNEEGYNEFHIALPQQTA